MVHLVPTEPPRGAIGDLRAFQTPGLDSVRRYIRGDLPGPPLSRLLGARPTEAGPGTVTFSMPITPWLEDGFGVYEGGIFALFADAPLALAIWTGLPAGKAPPTTELNLSFVRPITRATTNIVGRARTIHLGSQVALASIEISDQNGRLLGFGSTRCLIVDVPVDPDADLPAPDTGPDDPPDPYLREPPGEGCYFTLDDIVTMAPIDLQAMALLRGEVIFPITRLTGWRPTRIEAGATEGTLPTSPWFSNGGQAIYGGMLAWLADFMMGGAVYSMLDRGDVFATIDMHIRYIRPALVGTGDVTARAEVRHAGNRLRVSSCDITNAEGKRVAMATSSCLVLPGGAADLARGRLPDEILREAR
jgi:uncharacterized protein (TIGR00369 family)